MAWTRVTLLDCIAVRFSFMGGTAMMTCSQIDYIENKKGRANLCSHTLMERKWQCRWTGRWKY